MNLRKLALVLLVAGLAVPTGRDSARQVPVSASVPSPIPTRAANPARMSKLPLRFEANAGQWNEHVRFVAHQGGATLFVTDEGMTLGLRDMKATPHRPGMSHQEERKARAKALAEAKTAAISMKLVRARPSTPRGEKELVTKSNFFLGNDKTKWRTNVPNYGQVRAKDWVPGVDVVWHGGENGLEYDLEVAAGVDARQLAFEVEGADRVSVTEDGSLEIATAAGVLVQKAPRVVQDGRELAVRYRTEGARRVAFNLESYDPSSTLFIDPVLTYSTYLGGSGTDFGNGIAIDSGGNAYVAGQTASTNFPTASPYQATNGGGSDDVFVAKLNAAGSALVYSTYLGGNGADVGIGIAIDSADNAYVTGSTASTNFPTASAHQAANGGGTNDAFVAKLNAAGSALMYSTYLGGNAEDDGYAIAVDSAGSAYVAGTTNSTNFPTASAYQAMGGGTYADAFVTKLSPSGSALTYSTYLGGNGFEYAVGIAVDSAGSAYVSGVTESYNFPTASAYQSTASTSGPWDGFVTKLSSAGSTLVYSTYLGGNGEDDPYQIAIDSAGSAYVTGDTTSTNFPTATPYQGAYGGGTHDAFVTKLSAAGSALAYSTYLGGSSDDGAYGIAIDTGGRAYVAGITMSTNFPTAGAYQATNGGGHDAFVVKLSAAGSGLVYSTYLGGSSDDNAGRLALDGSGNAYMVGGTASTNFPTVGPYQGTYGGGTSDAFVIKFADPELAAGTACGNNGACASAHCADGVCCDTACADQCAACDVQGHVGTCTPVTGAPHGSRAACATNGPCAATCDGTNTKVCTYAPTACGSSCSNGSETDSLCDTAGNCAAQTPRSCNNLVCADTKTCKSTCTSNADCMTGFACASSGTCQTSATCTDDHTSKAANGTVTVCTPFKCDTTGSCKTSCNSVDDCVSPNVCDPSGKCVPPPSAPSTGCSCNAGTNGSAPWATALLTIAVASILTRRRRPRD